jgi:drug/metabolite transporter (DMT)-like permease
VYWWRGDVDGRDKPGHDGYEHLICFVALARIMLTGSCQQPETMILGATSGNHASEQFTNAVGVSEELDGPVRRRGTGVKPTNYRRGILLITGSAVAWSLAGLFTRLIHLDTWTLLAWRGIFGAIGIAVVDFTVHRRGAWQNLHRLDLPAWLYAIVGSVCMILYITALRQTTVAHVAVIYATVPFFAAALGWIWVREVPSLSAIVTSFAALAGVALMVGLGTQGSLFGDAVAVSMTATMALVMVIARRFRAIPAMTAASLSALLSGLICLPLSHPAALTGANLFLLALFGLVNSAAGLALFTLGARLLPTMETALIGSLDAPLAPLWVWLAFSETPSSSAIVGGLIVFTAVGCYLAVSALEASPLPSRPTHDSSRPCENSPGITFAEPRPQLDVRLRDGSVDKPRRGASGGSV